jgi:epoxyqueuosine reductase
VNPHGLDVSPTSWARQIKAAALQAGFDAVGICDLRPIERSALQEWLAHGYAGTMTYLNRQAQRRQQPERIVPGCRRAVVVLKNYFSEARPEKAAGRIARYAWGEDYHRIVGDQLRAIAETLIALGSTADLTRTFVDAGPVPERELAQRAGLGWMAKNTLLINPELGSFTFIGTVFTDLELAVDAPVRTDHCGSCRLCLDACPTDAFPASRVLDARRCISYLTIEWRKPFTADQGRLIDDWLFGCDVCQDVCPWNEKFARPSHEERFTPRDSICGADPQRLAAIDEHTFDEQYADTALARAGSVGISRNARQVLVNQGRSVGGDPPIPRNGQP